VPRAQYPVVQMSIDYTKYTEYHFELAAKLSALRDRGVLIIGSGNIIHNLRIVDFQRIHEPEYGFDWAQESRESINQLMLSGEVSGLISYEKLGKTMQLAVPTPDHYLPLIYILGLKRNDDIIRLFNDKVIAGSIGMTSVIIERN
jgi:4,5-DOPA dioxygenase extradiol